MRMVQRQKRWFMKWTAAMVAVVMMLGMCSGLPVSAAYENTHVNTGNQAEDLVAVAKTQIGYTESGNNDTKYNHWFGSLSGYGYNYAWCQTFVAWCANQAGISTSMIPRVSGTVSGMDFFKSNGTWHNGPYKGASYTPKKGDIIYFKSGASSSGYHVGIVSDCSSGTVYTIEGNSSDKVSTHEYSVSYSKIVGYGVPNYEGGNPSKPTLSITPGTSDIETVLTWNSCSNTDFYGVRIYYKYNDSYYLFEEPYYGTSYNVVLPEGEYYANIAAVADGGERYTFSDNIYFTVEKLLPGDLNSDSTLTTADAVLLQKHLLNQTTLTETQYNLADLNADGVVNGFDLALLRQKLLS